MTYTVARICLDGHLIGFDEGVEVTGRPGLGLVALAIMAKAGTSGRFDSFVETDQMSIQTDARDCVRHHTTIPRGGAMTRR